MLKDRAKDYHTNGNQNCAESLILAAIDEYNLQIPKECSKLLGGFGGGVGCGHLCGAVAGSVASIGQLTIDSCAHESKNLSEVRANFIESVNQKLGSIMCADLKQEYFDKEAKNCAAVVCAVAECLDEIVKKECKIANK